MAASVSMLIGATGRDGRPAQSPRRHWRRASPMTTRSTQGVAHHTLGVIATLTGFGACWPRPPRRSGRPVRCRDSVTAAIYTPPHAVPRAHLARAGRRRRGHRRRRRATASEPSKWAGCRGSPAAYFVAAVARFYAGRWDDALAELEAGQAVIERHRQLRLGALLPAHSSRRSPSIAVTLRRPRHA